MLQFISHVTVIKSNQTIMYSPQSKICHIYTLLQFSHLNTSLLYLGSSLKVFLHLFLPFYWLLIFPLGFKFGLAADNVEDLVTIIFATDFFEGEVLMADNEVDPSV